MSDKILVIDDEPGIREVLGIHLAAAGYEVTLTESAAEGFEAACSDEFDLVICDFSLPDTNGLKLVSAITDIRPGTRFVMISGFLDPETEERVTASGVADFLRKPFTRDTLLKSISGLLDNGVSIAADV